MTILKDTNTVGNGTITFIRSQWSNKVNMTLCACDATGTIVGIKWCQWYWKLNLFHRKDNWIGVQHGHVMPLILLSVPHDTDSIINEKTFYSFYVRMIEIRCSMTFWSCATIDIGINIAYNAGGIVNDTIEFARSRWLKWGATWCFGHVLPLTLT